MRREQDVTVLVKRARSPQTKRFREIERKLREELEAHGNIRGDWFFSDGRRVDPKTPIQQQYEG